MAARWAGDELFLHHRRPASAPIYLPPVEGAPAISPGPRRDPACLSLAGLGLVLVALAFWPASRAHTSPSLVQARQPDLRSRTPEAVASDPAAATVAAGDASPGPGPRPAGRLPPAAGPAGPALDDPKPADRPPATGDDSPGLPLPPNAGVVGLATGLAVGLVAVSGLLTARRRPSSPPKPSSALKRGLVLGD
jgi:hypothetical protein